MLCAHVMRQLDCTPQTVDQLAHLLLVFFYLLNAAVGSVRPLVACLNIYFCLLNIILQHRDGRSIVLEGREVGRARHLHRGAVAPPK
jgi:hypothetical protein